jgi:nucleotide-binding universal stress UspA family protein
MSTILAAIDFSDLTDHVLNHAVSLAKSSDAQLVLVHVAMPDPDFVGYEVGPQSVRESTADKHHEEHSRIQALVERCEKQSIKAKGLLVAGATVEKILEHANKLDAHYVVIGSHGHGAIYQMTVGSVTNGVLQHATIPVLVVPSPSR